MKATTTTRERLGDVERLQRQINALAGARQQLRATAATPEELEANRRQLVRAQQRLSRAALERYLPEALAQRAAA